MNLLHLANKRALKRARVDALIDAMNSIEEEHYMCSSLPAERADLVELLHLVLMPSESEVAASDYLKIFPNSNLPFYGSAWGKFWGTINDTTETQSCRELGLCFLLAMIEANDVPASYIGRSKCNELLRESGRTY